MTIYDIKKRTEKTNPNYFSRNNLKFFGQTMSGWKLKKQPDGRTRISQPIYDFRTRVQKGMSVRFFNPITNNLESE